jgi:hypothetical protein
MRVACVQTASTCRFIQAPCAHARMQAALQYVHMPHAWCALARQGPIGSLPHLGHEPALRVSRQQHVPDRALRRAEGGDLVQDPCCCGVYQRRVRCSARREQIRYLAQDRVQVPVLRQLGAAEHYGQRIDRLFTVEHACAKPQPLMVAVVALCNPARAAIMSTTVCVRAERLVHHQKGGSMHGSECCPRAVPHSQNVAVLRHVVPQPADWAVDISTGMGGDAGGVRLVIRLAKPQEPLRAGAFCSKRVTSSIMAAGCQMDGGALLFMLVLRLPLLVLGISALQVACVLLV